MKIIASLWLSLFFLSFEFDGLDAKTITSATVKLTTANTSTISGVSSFSTNTSKYIVIIR